MMMGHAFLILSADEERFFPGVTFLVAAVMFDIMAMYALITYAGG